MKTLKEIFDQPVSHRYAAEIYPRIAADSRRLISEKCPRNIYFVGCGSSYYIAMGLSKQVRRFAGKRVAPRYVSGSEIMLGLTKIESDSVVVGVSRSGESSETVTALEICKEKENVHCISLTCGSDSRIIAHSDASIVLDFVNEDSVVMTKSFTTMSFIGSVLARDLFDPGSVDSYLEEIPRSSEQVLRQAQNVINKLDLKELRSFVFLGYSEYLAACLEGTIKVMETSLASSNAFQTLEYRHGPISTVNWTTLVCILPGGISSKEEHALSRDVLEKGGKTLCISAIPLDHSCSISTGYCDDDYGDWFLRAIPMQMIGVKRAEGLGINPDNPVNLSKVVKL